MFEDVCLVCGKGTEGLYCSDVCRDKDTVQLPPSSIDIAIDLGFITDSIPPLVASSRTQLLEDPSTVSSPTSSVLTTPSVIDDLDQEYIMPLPTTNAAPNAHKVPDHEVSDLLSAKPLSANLRSPRIQAVHTQQPHLEFVRKAGPTNLHLPPLNLNLVSSSKHKRSTSFNISSGLQQPPHHHPHTHHTHAHGYASSSSHGRTSGQGSPTIQPADLPAHPTTAFGDRERERDKLRKKRARASLPAYFSNLMMSGSSAQTPKSTKIPSAAVSSDSGTPSPEHSQVRGVRSRSAVRAVASNNARVTTSAASTFKDSTSPPTPKVVRGRPGPTKGIIITSPAVVTPVTATRHASDPISDSASGTSFAERHIRFISAARPRKLHLAGTHGVATKSPPPPLSAAEPASSFASSLLFAKTENGKTRRYSSPATSSPVVPISLMITTAVKSTERARRGSSPQPIPPRRRGWTPVRGRAAAVFDDDEADVEEEDEDAVEDEQDEEPEPDRGRSRSRVRSRSRAKSRSHSRGRGRR